MLLIETSYVFFMNFCIHICNFIPKGCVLDMYIASSFIYYHATATSRLPASPSATSNSRPKIYSNNTAKSKSKAVPLNAMEALGGEEV
jgi:hypothetical protein